jgi:hypothetical protein
MSMNSSIVTPAQSQPWKNSIFSLPNPLGKVQRVVCIRQASLVPLARVRLHAKPQRPLRGRLVQHRPS